LKDCPCLSLRCLSYSLYLRNRRDKKIPRFLGRGLKERGESLTMEEGEFFRI